MKKPVLNAHRVVSTIRASSSTPIVVEAEDGRLYFVKLKGGMSGEFSNISEWVANQMGAALGLPVLQPQIIHLGPEVQKAHIYIEVRELIEKSYGPNVAFPFLENIENVKPAHLANWPEEQKAALFFFDVFLLNIDRTLQNTNLLLADHQWVAYDFETCFLIKGLLTQSDFSQHPQVIGQLRRNPCFVERTNETLALDTLKKIGALDFEALTDTMPLEWWGAMPAERKGWLREGLAAAASQVARYLELLQKIQQTDPESDTDRAERIRENRIRFEQRFA